MKNETVCIEIKNNFGTDHFYPANEKAELFTRLTGNKTLTLKDLANIKALGYTVEPVKPALFLA